jgi:hypothetical protein
MMLTINLRAPIYKELEEAAGEIIGAPCSVERFAEQVIESEMASRRLEKMECSRLGLRAPRLANTGLRLGAPIP